MHPGGQRTYSIRKYNPLSPGERYDAVSPKDPNPTEFSLSFSKPPSFFFHLGSTWRVRVRLKPRKDGGIMEGSIILKVPGFAPPYAGSYKMVLRPEKNKAKR